MDNTEKVERDTMRIRVSETPVDTRMTDIFTTEEDL